MPRYSLRWLLGLTTVCALLFAVFGIAVRGKTWAICISVGVGTLGLMAILYALLYTGIAFLASLGRRRSGASPFQRIAVTVAADSAETRKQGAIEGESAP